MRSRARLVFLSLALPPSSAPSLPRRCGLPPGSPAPLLLALLAGLRPGQPSKTAGTAWGLGGSTRQATTSMSDSGTAWGLAGGARRTTTSVADLGGGAGRATTSTAGFKTPTRDLEYLPYLIYCSCMRFILHNIVSACFTPPTLQHPDLDDGPDVQILMMVLIDKPMVLKLHQGLHASGNSTTCIQANTTRASPSSDIDRPDSAMVGYPNSNTCLIAFKARSAIHWLVELPKNEKMQLPSVQFSVNRWIRSFNF